MGLLRKMDDDSTKATYLLDDHTGQLNAYVFNTDNAEPVRMIYYVMCHGQCLLLTCEQSKTVRPSELAAVPC